MAVELLEQGVLPYAYLMHPPQNIALIRHYIEEVWNAGDVSQLEKLFAPGYRRHLSPNADPLTTDGQRQRITEFRQAFPDIRFTIEDIMAEDDRVMFRCTVQGTHQGTFLGILPTNKRVTVSLLDVIRLEEGWFLEHWGGPDLLDLVHQLGASVKEAGSGI